jgi:predicted PurR-regulated permease PerM
MSATNDSSVDQMVLKTVMASLVQVIAVLLLLYWCFTILSPFLSIIIWGLIISVALYPTHVSLSARLGGREKLSATILI